MSNIAISVKNISKSFRIPHEKVNSLRGAFVGMFKGKRTHEEFRALNDVSFEVKKGEFFGIIGRNGSGKSTLLKILAGIYQPDKGKVTVNGMISPFLELGIGFNPELSGRDNIYLNATVLGLTRKEIDEKFDKIVAFSELERFIDQKLKNYSSGMQVRLAFAVSIHANRDILLMDEVLAVGDNNFQSKCLEEFNRYRDIGRTVVLVTHDISVVERYCDRAMLLRNGKVIAIDKADEVANKYIHQNIDDEEVRFTKKEDDQTEDLNEEGKRIEKAAEIIKVELFDESGKKQNNFKTNDDVEIRVYFKFNREKREHNVGLSIETIDKDYIFGYTTEADKFLLDLDKGFVSLFLKKVPFLRGSYKINVTLYGQNNTEIFDFRPGIQVFNMFSLGKDSRYKGYLSLDHEWKEGME